MTDLIEWLQLLLFTGVLALSARPLGLHLFRVLSVRGRTCLDSLLKPVERFFYRLMGVDPEKEQQWVDYAGSLLLFSFLGFLFAYAVLRLQHLLPMNPEGYGPLSPDLAFNTAMSFTTNTNWQNYGGERTLSYFSQAVGLVYHNFASAAVGIAVAGALMRGLAANGTRTVGNFWADLVRVHLYVLLPACLLYSVFLVSQGGIQNFHPYVIARGLERAGSLAANPGSPVAPAPPRLLAQGPVASQEAVKMLGTNGGGFMNANSAHPYENPTPLSNFVQVLSILLIPGALTYTLGLMTRNRRHGWAVFCAMMLLFIAGVLACWWAESRGNPRLQQLGVDPGAGNMEGKEVRFGVFGSCLFAVATTAASCGAVNAMHDSFTPLGGLVLLLNIQLGEVIFGGVGAGLYGILVFVVLTVFLTGLMVGRTPEYLGKKIQAYEVKVCVLILLVSVFGILGFSAWAATSPEGISAVQNGGPHGLSEILYAFSSATGNNGSAFAGFQGNTPWLNSTLGLAMFLGRFPVIVLVLALAGSLSGKKILPSGAGSFPVENATFVALLVGTIVIVGTLTFLPALSLGPIVEHFLMVGSTETF